MAPLGEIMIQELPELHDHLADGLLVVGLLVGLVHRHTDRPGAGQAGAGQAASGQRNAVRVVGREKSAKRCVRDTYRHGKLVRVLDLRPALF